MGLLEGHSGSQVLDDRLNPLAVAMWGAALAVGALLGLLGIICYRDNRRLMAGLILERSGLALVGASASIYTIVVLLTASDVSDVRYTAAVQAAFALAAIFRAYQAHKAIRFAHQMHSLLDSGDQL